MGIMNAMMGKTKMESFEEFEKEIEEQFKKYKGVSEMKREKIEKRMRKKMRRFFKELYKLGVEVELEKKDGKGLIIKKDLDKIPFERLFKVYVVKTIKEINKKIKEDGKK